MIILILNTDPVKTRGGDDDDDNRVTAGILSER